MMLCAGDEEAAVTEADLKRLRLVRGLSNDSGFNNCFLNVVIQSLWHLRPFREALLGLPSQARALHCTTGSMRYLPGSCRCGCRGSRNVAA